MKPRFFLLNCSEWRKPVSFMLLLFAVCTIHAQDSKKLSGQPFGSPNVDYETGQSSPKVNTPGCAFDGDLSTFYASYDRSFTWVGLDLGSPHVITRVGWSPRNDHTGPNCVQLGLFEGSNREDFLDAVPLYLIPETGEIGTIDHADVCVSRGFRYVRYLGPDNARCNIAELEFYGYEGTGDDSRFYQLTNLPTLSIQVHSGQEPYDKENELESNMTLVYDNGTRIQEYPITTRLRGNASIQFPKKPYRIKFNDGKSHHMLKDSPLESPAKAKKWTLINNYGDKTLMRNILAFEISKRVGMPYTPYCQPVDVIMNGEYKGCYQLCDQITIDPHRIPINEMERTDVEEPFVNGGYLVEIDGYADNNKPEQWFTSNSGIPVTIKEPDKDIVPAQYNYIKDFFNQMEQKVFASNYTDEKNGYRSMLDLESFIKHFIVCEFSGNTDTYWSVYMYKDRNEDIFHVGPCWDFDLAFNNDARIYPVCNRNSWVYTSGGSYAHNMNDFVTRVLSDPYTDAMLKDMWKEKTESGAFDPESLVQFIDSMANVLDASQRLNFIRWPILDTKVHENAFALGSYEAEVGVLREYIPERIEWISKYFTRPENKDTTLYIATANELIEFANYVNRGVTKANGVLTANIDMKGQTNYIPIGQEGTPYIGEFDGQGYVISNLTVKGENYIGIFGVVGGGTYIHDFTVDSSCSIEGTSYLGIVGGSNGSGNVKIERVGNEAKISGSDINVSGIFGCNMGSEAKIQIVDCYNAGKIEGNRESAAISGWLGKDATVENCYSIGDVSGTEDYMAFVRGKNATLTNCYDVNGKQVTILDENQIVSGELCYKLNNGNNIWRQDLGKDKHPVLCRSHALVHYDKETDTYYNKPDYTLADVNNDGMIAIDDVVLSINGLLGDFPENFVFAAADMNGDGLLLVDDVVQIINAMLNADLSSVQSKVRGAETGETLSLSGYEGGFSVTLDNAGAYTAMQFDMHLPEGAGVEDIRIKAGDGHRTVFSRKENGVVRAVVVSLSNKCFSGEDLLDVMIDAADDTEIQITNARLASRNGSVSKLHGASVVVKGNATGIGRPMDSMAKSDIYDLSGRLVKKGATTTAGLKKGVYFINGKKVELK